MTPADEAAAALEELGLTEYEAQCLVALTRVPHATAKDVSQMAEIPRSRVYDIVDRLYRRGLVDVQESDPRVFRAVSREAALTRLRRDYESAVETASQRLAALDKQETPRETGVWAIADHGHVTDRAVDLVDDAEETIHLLIADETVVEDRLVDRVTAADDRGVRTLVETPSEAVRDRFAQAVPDAAVVVSDRLAETKRVVEKWPGKLLVVDGRAVLASGVEEGELPDVIEEAAVWSTGRDHGFATWLRELVSDREGPSGDAE